MLGLGVVPALGVLLVDACFRGMKPPGSESTRAMLKREPRTGTNFICSPCMWSDIFADFGSDCFF